MKVIRVVYGHGFTEKVGGPDSFTFVRAYREITADLEPGETEPEANSQLEELVDALLDSDYTRMVGE